MSYNKLLNAVIALIEDRPSDARDMLRSPEMKIPIGEVQGRVFEALDKRAHLSQIDALKSILRSSLRIDADKPKGKVNWSDEQREAYLMGVAAVECIIEDYLGAITPQA